MFRLQGFPLVHRMVSRSPVVRRMMVSTNCDERGCRSRQPAGVAEAVGAELAEDDVVEQLDAENFTRLADSFGQAAVAALGRLAQRGDCG